MTLAPSLAERILCSTAQEHACPTPRNYHYVLNRPDGTTDESAEWDATCISGRNDNGFYGHGIVNALAAVS